MNKLKSLLYGLLNIIGIILGSAAVVVLAVGMPVLIYSLALAILYGVPALILSVVGALALPLFGVPVVFGWTLYWQSMAVVFALRFVGAYLNGGKTMVFPKMDFARKQREAAMGYRMVGDAHRPQRPRRHDCTGDGRNMSPDESIAEGIDMLARAGH